MTRLAILLLAALPLSAQLNVETIAGGKPRTGVPAQDVSLSFITGLAWDFSGNLVFCDRSANLIRRIRPDGILETLAGTGTTGFSGDGGPALDATLNSPGSPRFDSQGNLYFADAYNYRIRRIDTRGIITTVAGDGIRYTEGMDRDGPAFERSLSLVSDLAVDSRGNVYFVDNYTVIRRATPAGRLATFGPATGPNYLAIDSEDNLYVAEGGSSNYADIVRFTPAGDRTLFAGNGPFTNTPTNDDGQPANGLYIYRITGLAAAAGRVYFTQESVPGTRNAPGPRIRYVDSSGIVHTLATGTPTDTLSTSSIAADPAGNVAFPDSPNGVFASRIRLLTPQSSLQTIAGGAPKPAPAGTPARDAWFLSPTALAIDRAGDLFIAESGACLIRKISPTGDLTTFAGTGTCAEARVMQPATGPDLPIPARLAADSRGRLYMLDTLGNSYIISADGKLAPTGFYPVLGNARIAIDSKDRVYLFSISQGLRISPDGTQQVIVQQSSQPGVPPQGFGPTSISAAGTDPSGNVYFTGTYLGSPTDYIFRVNDDASFTQVYGSTAAPLHLLGDRALAIGANGDAWLANGALYVINTRGQLGIGISDGGDAGDGGPAQFARFNTEGLAFAPSGDLYLLDNNRVRKITGVARAKAPVISAGGIVNAFTFAGGPIAPGEAVSIFGSGFATGALQVAAPVNNRYPWGLGRLKVYFNGYPGAITAVTPTQINVFVPGWFTAGEPVAVVVQLDDAASAPVTVQVAKAAPGLFPTVTRTGNILTLYGTGEGGSTPQLLWGDLTISTPYPTPNEPVTVTANGQPAEILYLGAAPYLPTGIFQLNVRVPAGATTLTLTIAGVSTTLLL
ncbi:MAG: hypothetical protein ABI759_14600 [Candidatus Solibacter sp.]